ncbi:gamma-glutamyltransferase [Robiginitomaculum antarcticum]|uniref:gamma-glutamyltransferase n=1 Tax=Robiginitomaculum antarcticum TaxID=437507 RepID=UPI000365F3D6|nr:gamma-glutamyltransferase [Robiginitomaculum antarcticum]
MLSQINAVRLSLSISLTGLLCLIALPAFAQGVVSSADPRASEAGLEMLEAGGSATDAALAMMITLTVVEPQSSGIGGGGFFVHHDARTAKIDTIDGRERAPGSATPERFLDEQGQPIPFNNAFPGGLSVGIPGNIRLMEEAHRRWGTLPWAKLFEPAIKLANEGFEVSPRFSRTVTRWSQGWQDFPDIAALYAPDGKPVSGGDIIRNPKLAALLTRISIEGAPAFYYGENPRVISDVVAEASRNPAQVTPLDFSQYTATPRAAVCSQYRKYRVCGMGPPSSGATTVLGILGLLERFDLKTMGPNSAHSWHLIADAMRLTYADRSIYTGDNDFAPVPVEGLIDPDYLQARSALIDANIALGKVEAGTPPGSSKSGKPAPINEGGTTHFSVVDATGNVVAMTSTIEGVFGSQLLANGMVLNNELTDFSFIAEENGHPVTNRVQAFKRPRSSMSPTIVYNEQGEPILALGSAGGPRIIMHVLKTLVGVIDFDLNAEEAIALPNIFFDDDQIILEDKALSQALKPRLEQLGHSVRLGRQSSKVNAVEKIDGKWVGAADPRSDGVALTAPVTHEGK